MFENGFGRVLGGALWGLGAGVALSVLGAGGPGLRPLAKTAMRAYVSATDWVRERTAEAREELEDLYAEVKAEAQPTAAAAPGPERQP